jgi:hypothetical protein
MSRMRQAFHSSLVAKCSPMGVPVNDVPPSTSALIVMAMGNSSPVGDTPVVEHTVRSDPLVDSWRFPWYSVGLPPFLVDSDLGGPGWMPVGDVSAHAVVPSPPAASSRLS